MTRRKTAAELMAELSSDEDFQKAAAERDRKLAIFEHLLATDQESILRDLTSTGFQVGSVWDLVNSAEPYPAAIPVLLKHLELPHHPRILAGIARALAVSEAMGRNDIWDVLVDKYVSTTADEDIVEPERRGLKEGLAVALSALADRSRLEELMALIRDDRHGESRVLLVDGLRVFLADQEAAAFLRSLLGDEVLGRAAKKALQMER